MGSGPDLQTLPEKLIFDKTNVKNNATDNEINRCNSALNSLTHVLSLNLNYYFRITYMLIK